MDNASVTVQNQKEANAIEAYFDANDLANNAATLKGYDRVDRLGKQAAPILDKAILDVQEIGLDPENLLTFRPQYQEAISTFREKMHNESRKSIGEELPFEA